MQPPAPRLNSVLLMLCAWAMPVTAALPAKTLDKPLAVQVTLAEKSERVAGSLVRYDDGSIVIKTGKGERTLPWSTLTPASQYSLRSQLIDRKSGAQWLELAELGMRLNLKDQAKAAVTEAGRIDPTTKLKGDAILRGQGPAKPTTGSAPAGGKADGAAIVKFQKSTPEQDDQAIALAQRVAKTVGEQLRIGFAELQTPHFIIFTNWDPREYDFLKTNCEAAYAAVSKQFDIPVKENIFIGKLPVFMFATQTEFRTYAQQFDNFPVPRNVAGYYTSRADGSGHMVMWKPDVQTHGLREAERRWASTLTHEFTHAFVARYRTNRPIPRWLNEGLAEVISENEFPTPTPHQFARMMAGQPFDFEALFDDDKMPGGEMYPVMQTMVEAMIRDNRKGFLDMFNDIKDGMDAQDAMRKHYKAGYKDWEPAWRNYAKRL